MQIHVRKLAYGSSVDETEDVFESSKSKVLEHVRVIQIAHKRLEPPPLARNTRHVVHGVN